MHTMTGESVRPDSVIGLGDTPGGDDHHRPRGHEHYQDGEGEHTPLPQNYGEGAVATRQQILPGAVAVHRDLRVIHTPVITE